MLLIYGDELLIYGDELLIYVGELLIYGDELLIYGDELLIYGDELLTDGDELLTDGDKLLTDGDELLTDGGKLHSTRHPVSNFWTERRPAPFCAGEADRANNRYASRNPAKLSKNNMPDKARLYARWQTQTGLVSDWSAPLLVTVR